MRRIPDERVDYHEQDLCGKAMGDDQKKVWAIFKGHILGEIEVSMSFYYYALAAGKCRQFFRKIKRPCRADGPVCER